jgi:hypothetical protein
MNTETVLMLLVLVDEEVEVRLREVFGRWYKRNRFVMKRERVLREEAARGASNK